MKVLCSLFLLFLAAGTMIGGDVTAADRSPGAAAASTAPYPTIVLYSTSWCPHCKEARKYFTEHRIPFTDKDVEADESAMNEMKTRYKSLGVPVIVIGDDEKVLKGFKPDSFEKSVQEVRQKRGK